MAIDCIAEISGAVELSNWFGGFPSFHDAPARLQIAGDGSGWLEARSYQIGADGNFEYSSPFVAKFAFEGLVSVSLADFADQIILNGMEIRKSEGAFELIWEAAYGAFGSIVSRRPRAEFEKGSIA